jgi:branched-chain amino acid transport system permease protein
MSLDSSFSLLAQTLLNAATLGCIYCLVSLGFNLVYGSFRQFFFVISEILMFGAFVFYWSTTYEIHYIVSLLIAMGVCALIAVVLERVFYSKVRGKWLESLLISLGLVIVVHNAVFYLWGQTTMVYHVDFPWFFQISGFLGFYSTKLFVMIFTVSMLILLQLFITKTYYGKAIRATGQDVDVATILGIDVDRIAFIVFAVSGALAAVAGSFLGTLYVVDVQMGVPFMLKMFAVVVLAGSGNFMRTIYAALLIAVTENLVISYVPGGGQWQDMITFAIIVLVLTSRYVLRRT